MLVGAPPGVAGLRILAGDQAVAREFEPIDDGLQIDIVVDADPPQIFLRRSQHGEHAPDADFVQFSVHHNAAFPRSGNTKEHPALRHELAARAFVAKMLLRLGLDVEPMHSRPGRPSGQRAGWQPPIDGDA